MLNLNVKFKVELQKTTCPIYFDKKNICLKCGAHGTLRLIDKFGKAASKEIYPFEYIQCNNCGEKFSILWQDDETVPNKMYPVAVDRSLKQEFLNTMDYPKIRAKGEKSI